eukprot:gene24855-30032_t
MSGDTSAVFPEYFMEFCVHLSNAGDKEPVDIEGRKYLTDLTEVELAFIQHEYYVMLGPFADYANLIIQYGYATLFICAYPLLLAMIKSFISNYVELRVDPWKLCQQCRPPEPRSFSGGYRQLLCHLGDHFGFLRVRKTIQ